MQKRLTTLFLIASAIGFAMPTLAAPTIVSKTELKIPMVNQTILNRFYKLIYPEKAAVSNKPFTVSFQEELPCGGTTYRLWMVEKNLKVPIFYGPHQGTAHSVGIVYQAISGAGSKWATEVANTGSGIPTFLGCDGSNVIIADQVKGMREATFNNLVTPTRWDMVKPAESDIGIEQVDGITQQPGYLYMANQCEQNICSNKQPWGSSAILVFKDGKVQKMEPPHYRDLSDPSIDLGNYPDAFLKAMFYRLSDGYLVVEVIGRNVVDPTQGGFVESNSNPKLNVYRIHDGEPTYTKIVDSIDANHASSLPIQPQYKYVSWVPTQDLIVVNQPTNYGVYASDAPAINKILIHGFNRKEVSIDNVKFSWQAANQYTVRYIFSSPTDGTHYWQAIVKE